MYISSTGAVVVRKMLWGVGDRYSWEYLGDILRRHDSETLLSDTLARHYINLYYIYIGRDSCESLLSDTCAGNFRETLLQKNL